MKAWLFIMGLLLAIGVFAIWLGLQPAIVNYRYLDDPRAWGLPYAPPTQVFKYAPSLTDILGLKLRAEAWLTYPKYNIGLGVIGVLALAGSVFACREVYQSKEAKEAGVKFWED